MDRPALATARIGVVAIIALVASAALAQAPTGVASARFAQTAAINASPATSTTVSGIAREALRDQARDWMAAQTSTDAGLIRVGALDGRVDPPPCDSAYRFDFPFESRTTIRAVCDNPVRQYYMRVSVERTRQRLVFARSMSAGEIVAPSDLVVRELAGGSGFDNVSQVVGRSVRRAVAAGEAPQSTDLEDVVSVLRATSDLRAGQAIGASVIRTELLPREQNARWSAHPNRRCEQGSSEARRERRSGAGQRRSGEYPAGGGGTPKPHAGRNARDVSARDGGNG